VATVDDQPVPLQTALEAVAALLQSAASPLFFGFRDTPTTAMREWFHLAERLRATIDPAGCAVANAATLAFQQCGQSSWTLGELQQRADLLIFWRMNPEQSHPRLLPRIKNRGTACRILHWNGAENDVELLHQVRLLLAGWPVPKPLPGATELQTALMACHHGALLFGDELAALPNGQRAITEVLRLAAELNTDRRFYAMNLTNHGTSGAESMLTWQTGFAHAVNFSTGAPRSQPGLFTAADMLARGEIDIAIQVGSHDYRHWPRAAADALHRIKLVQILPAGATDIGHSAAVRIITGTAGIHEPSIAARFDDIRIPLPTLSTTHYPHMNDVVLGLNHALNG
jgi:formylmethanofuran dehydrogenase subunit B